MILSVSLSPYFDIMTFYVMTSLGIRVTLLNSNTKPLGISTINLYIYVIYASSIIWMSFLQNAYPNTNAVGLFSPTQYLGSDACSYKPIMTLLSINCDSYFLPNTFNFKIELIQYIVIFALFSQIKHLFSK